MSKQNVGRGISADLIFKSLLAHYRVKRAKKGIFITTSSFSKEAIDFVAKIDSKIILIDGDQLAEYMIDFNVGVTTTYSTN